MYITQPKKVQSCNYTTAIKFFFPHLVGMGRACIIGERFLLMYCISEMCIMQERGGETRGSWLRESVHVGGTCTREKTEWRTIIGSPQI